MDWSNQAREIVAETLAKLPAGATLKEKRKALRAAYPFGPCGHWPYRAWLRACRQQLGLPVKKSKRKKPAPAATVTISKPDEGRMIVGLLFDD